MIELDGRDEAEIFAIATELAVRGRSIATAGSKVLSHGGIGNLSFPLPPAPMLAGRHIALQGAGYAIPGDTYGKACCPHYCTGTIAEGAADVVFQGRPVVMVGHRGSHWHVCDGQHAPAVVVEGWNRPYQPWKDYGLASPRAQKELGSGNLDHTFRYFKAMSGFTSGE